MTPIETLILFSMLSMFYIVITYYIVKKYDFIEKIGEIAASVDLEKAAPLAIELIKVPEVQEFMYSAFMNAVNAKAHVFKPYMDDFFKSMKGKVLSNGGVAAKTRKRAASTIVEMTLQQHPLGKAAMMFAGDDIKEMIAEDPEQALEIVNMLVANFKGKGSVNAVDKGDIEALSPMLAGMQRQ